MTESLETDVVVLGAGAAGENAAGRVVGAGLESIIVESALVGGECSYWACMPSKALLRPGTALAEARAVDGTREAVTRAAWTSLPSCGAAIPSPPTGTMLRQVQWVKDTGIGLVRGRARLTAERTVEITDDAGTRVSITARHAVVLATGSVPIEPPVEGLADVQYWGTREATSSDEVPGRLLVLGARCCRH